ncbi:MAG: SRPBCC domain-containing protein [Verrucomicrobiia bacterium]
MTEKNDLTTSTSDLTLVLTHEFNVPRELVWKAWTEPEQVKKWMELGENITMESVQVDLRVGGKFRSQIKMADGEFFTVVGTYLEVKAPERLVCTSDWEKDGSGTGFGELEGNETQVTVELLVSGKGTQVVLTHEKFTSIEMRDQNEQAWQSWMRGLTKFLEGK